MHVYIGIYVYLNLRLTSKLLLHHLLVNVFTNFSEHIMSTVGPFSYFAASALVADNRTVKDVHLFLDQLFTMNTKKKTNLLDEISSIFIPDYNLIVNNELHILQIHRLVWLAAVRATQRQRSNDPFYRRMQHEQLLTNSLDEIVRLT